MVSGDIREIAIQHPELDDLLLEAKSGEDATIMLGGYKANDDDGNIGANGTPINQLNRFPWSAEQTIIAKPGDLDALQAMTENPLDGTFIITYMDGTTRQGLGRPKGDLQENKQSGTIGFKGGGGGRLDLQS